MRFPSVDFAARVLNGAVQFPCCSLPDSSVHSSEFLHSAVQLRCYPQRQLGLRCFCQLWGTHKRSVQPGKKIPVNKQLVSQQGGQIRKRPSEGRQQLQVTQNQHSNQRRPNLGFNRIRVYPEEGIDLQVLFDRLEKQLYLPAILVDRCDRRRRKVEVVGQEGERSLAFFVPDLDDSEEMLAVGNSLAVEVDNLILEDIAAYRSILNHLEGGIILQACDEIDALIGQLDKPFVIDIAPIQNHDRASFKSESPGHFDIAGLSIGNHGKRRQVAVMVQKQVQFDRTFGSSELSPVEQREGQVDDAGIKAHEFVLELELPSGVAAGHTELTFCQQLLKDGLVERPGTVGISVCERGAFRGNANAEVLKLAFATGQSSADLAETMRATELAEKHGDKLAPAGKSFGSVVGTMLFHGLFEFQSGKQLKQLREDARKSMHGWASLVDRLFAKINLLQVSARRALFIFYPVAAFN